MKRDYMSIGSFLKRAEETGEPSGGGVDPKELAILTSTETVIDDEDDNINSANTSNNDDSNDNIDKSNQDTSEEFKASTTWDIFKNDEGFKLPENLSKENEEVMLREAIAKKFNINIEPEPLHPLAKQIQDMSKTNPDISINDIVNNVQSTFIDASKMSADEKITFDMKSRYGIYDAEKNPDGLTDEDIKAYIDKLTKPEKLQMASSIEKNIEAYNQEMLKEYETEKKETYLKQYDTIVASANKYVDDIKNIVSKQESIYGIPVNPEQIESYVEEFRKMVIPNKETGERGIDKLLSDDVLLFKMFYLATSNGEEEIVKLITKGRETAKEEILKKLGVTPSPSGHREHTNKSLSFEQELDILKNGNS